MLNAYLESDSVATIASFMVIRFDLNHFSFEIQELLVQFPKAIKCCVALLILIIYIVDRNSNGLQSDFHTVNCVRGHSPTNQHISL